MFGAFIVRVAEPQHHAKCEKHYEDSGLDKLWAYTAEITNSRVVLSISIHCLYRLCCQTSRCTFEVFYVWFPCESSIAAFEAIRGNLLSHFSQNRVQELLAHVFVDRVVDWLEGHDLLIAAAAFSRSETYKASVIVCLHPFL